MSEHIANFYRRHIGPETIARLEQVAYGLDIVTEDAAAVLPLLAEAGLPRIGVPQDLGGSGGDIVDAAVAVAQVSELSLAAGFVLWGHRTFIEYLLESPNGGLRNRLLPKLLTGELAGATGLSNAMKFLQGLEELSIGAKADGDGLLLNGKLPWVTNLRREGFRLAAAVSRQDGSAFIASLAHDAPGLRRSDDLDLFGLRSTNTAALAIADVRIGEDDIICEDALLWLPHVRPAFLGLQCGMSIGLARRSLNEARAIAGAGVLREPLASASARLEASERALYEGLRSNVFQANPAELFRLRIAFADLVNEAVGLELQASGGKAYLTGPGQGFQRRWREAAFIPVITPSVVQLKTALARHAYGRDAA